MTREIHETHWAVFCRVIDNHGDLGFCWRLSAQLADSGCSVSLYVDNADALRWMAPHGHPNVEVMPWPTDEAVSVDTLPDVVIEAFGCELPQAWHAAMAASTKPPVWINLEYFSAEDHAVRNHGLPSPVLSGPAKGLTKWFYYPGLGQDSGGLLSRTPAKVPSHAELPSREQALQISVFCYEPAGMVNWLSQLAHHPTGVACWVTAGRATQAVTQSLQSLPKETTGLLSVHYLPYMSQEEYDQCLSSMDLNLVRGEDSLVRAMHAGKPFLWQIYPQHDGAHVPKLHAFLERTQAPAAVVQAHWAWNSDTPMPLPELDHPTLTTWAQWAQNISRSLSQQTGLVERLSAFAATKG